MFSKKSIIIIATRIKKKKRLKIWRDSKEKKIYKFKKIQKIIKKFKLHLSYCYSTFDKLNHNRKKIGFIFWIGIL
ncbi:hypothetical protein PNEG_04347 [Pneumocystis murina B123]|uniref:Uncharacterized protein n=1 Tax=Pneumocystis murina (strain B123) TaxID=1069680 RepID=A0A0W4ZWV6_PNEMU|nr:hypothetical protein PNEG_04347 [Pneumocystis murina B123]KTW32846.1 hypothetical protein PNEG_04347 [Pneumocystis murina B123]